MNQEDIILLGKLLKELDEDETYDDVYGELIAKAIIVSEQARVSKEYQEKMDELNNELSSLGKDGEDGKNEKS